MTIRPLYTLICEGIWNRVDQGKPPLSCDTHVHWPMFENRADDEVDGVLVNLRQEMVTDADVREMAAESGWVSFTDDEGKTHDLCPEHAEEDVRPLTDASPEVLLRNIDELNG
jgi:hypothetical protein